MTYVYIYIYRERERDDIYIYIYIERERETAIKITITDISFLLFSLKLFHVVNIRSTADILGHNLIYLNSNTKKKKYRCILQSVFHVYRDDRHYWTKIHFILFPRKLH
jgi:hypothetical protein